MSEILNYNDQTYRIVQLEQELRASEARFRSIITRSADAIILVDTDGYVLYANPSAEQLFGRTTQQLIGSEFGFPLVAGETTELDILRSHHGMWEAVSAEMRLTKTEWNGTRAFLANLRDITERKRAEQALRQSEERFAKAFRTRTVAITLETLKEGRYIDVNDTFLRLTGYRRDEVIGHTTRELGLMVYPEERERYIVSLQKEHSLQGFEVMYRAKSGEIRYGVASIETIDIVRQECILSHFQDISERRQQEREREAIISIAIALRVAQTPIEMLPIILKQAQNLLKAQASLITLRNIWNRDVVIEQVNGNWTLYSDLRIRDNDESSDRVLSSGQTYSIDAPGLGGETSAIRAVMGVPLIADGAPIGAIWAGRPFSFTPDDLRLLTVVAEIAANALHRASLHEHAQLQIEHLTALRTIDTAITTTLDLRTSLNVIIEQVIEQLQIDAAAILLYNEHLHTLEYTVGRGFRTHIIEQSAVRLGEGYAGRSALLHELVTVADIRHVDPPFTRPNLIAAEGFISYYAVPLVAKGQIKGLLELYHRKSLRMDMAWLNFLETLSAQAAIAVENATLFRDLQRSTVELTIAYDTTLEGWTRALDLRDKETEGHTQRVTEMTVRLARTMGLSDAELVHIRRGALLHDIGKMGIPDSILHKPGPLSSEEWVVMRKHPQYAFDMLSPISFLRPALDIPYCHHERWDGTGYPRGLASDQIPLASRIFSVVDVWDALRSERHYHGAWPEEQVRRYLLEKAGTQFDPKVVEAFLALPINGSGPSQDRPAILIVDDTEGVLRSLTRSLRDHYTVYTATSGDAALQILRHNEVAVIITDQRMPGISGVQLLERAREIRPEAVGLLISAYSDIQSLIEAINLGTIRGFLHKPWDSEELHRRVKDLTEQYQTRVNDRKVLGSSASMMRDMRCQVESMNHMLDTLLAGEIDALFTGDGQPLRIVSRLPLQRDYLTQFTTGIALVDLHGAIVYYNPACARVLGIESHAEVQPNLLLVPTVAASAPFLEVIRSGCSGQVVRSTFPFETLEGIVRTIEIVAVPLVSSHEVEHEFQLILVLRESDRTAER